ncbi:ARF guanine-nucleotide exchange factor [Spathaspora sp. JA1]|nr:ARF guanine-nucleotide exchange factor [Spathaspora sp. JA1]
MLEDSYSKSPTPSNSVVARHFLKNQHPPASSLSSGSSLLPSGGAFSSNYSHPIVSMNPITLMINECMTMASAMRKMNRWNNTGVAAILAASDIFGGGQNNDDIDGITVTSTMPTTSHDSARGSGGGTHRSLSDNPLLASFLQLKSILSDAKDLNDIDSLTLLQPFLLVIKSSSTSGHITSLSLQAISKFLTYGIISSRSNNIQNCLIQIISSLTHCRFEAADQNSDDAILLKVLRLLEEIITSQLSILLPDEIVSEVVQISLSLACNKKRSEVLRRAAEMAMVSITVKIFSKLKEIEPEPEFNEDLQTNFSDTKLPEDLIGGTDIKPSEINTPRDSNSDDDDTETAENEQYETETETDSDHIESYGIVCINEFLGILVSMISPTNQYQHMESTRVFALSLINIIIEVAGLEIPKHPPLLTLISDPISKHILQIITTTDSPALLKASLQLFTTVSIVLGRQLKPQFELTLSLIFQSILPTTSKNQNDNFTGANVSSRNSLSKEMLIESLSLLWTRSPVFFTNLFIDYDCDFEKSDLSIKIIEFLSTLALPESALITTDNVPPICLEGILSFIAGINNRIKATKEDIDSIPLHDLIQQRKKKTAFIHCTEVLNDKPQQGVQCLAKEGFIKDEDDLQEVAQFFFSKSGRLNKKILGEFLAKPKNGQLFGHFIDLFDFKDLRVDEALRILLKTFRLPGESQQIERVVEKFAERYVACQTDSTNLQPSPSKRGSIPNENVEPVRPDRDSVFVLSYSIIMLNTDLHNPQVKQQMLLEDYRRNLRGVYNGKDFPEWYLAKIYSSIKDREIIMPEEHHGTDKWFDDAWHNLVSTQDFKSENQDQLEFDGVQLCQFDKCIFETVVDKLITTIINIFKEASDDHIITRLMSSIDKIANICLYYNLSDSIDKLIDSLSDLSSLTRVSFTDPDNDDNTSNTTNNNIREEIPITEIRIEKKQEEIITVSELAVWFGRDFKAQLSTVVLFRLIKKNDCKISPSWTKVVKIILRLFENCLINPNLFGEFQKKIKLGPLPKVNARYIIKRTKPLNNSGILSTFSSFLKGYSDNPPEPTDQEIESTLSTIDCIKSLNIANIFAIISKGSSKDLSMFVKLLLDSFPEYTEKTKRFYETEVLFLLEISVCFCLLLNEKNLIDNVLDKITNISSHISKKGKLRILAYTLLLMRYSEGSPNLIETIKSVTTVDKELINKQGTQILQPLLSLVDDDSWCCKTLLVEEEYWKALRTFASIQTYAQDIISFLEGIIKSSNDITPENYVAILGLLDEVSSLGAMGSQFEQEHEHLELENVDNKYFQELIQLSKSSIKLTCELGPIVQNKGFKDKGLSYSLLQALAHQCFNPCREVRKFAVKSLQTVALSLEAGTATDNISAYGIFEFGLFPLLIELSKPEVIQTDINGFAITQYETFSLVSRVFLKHIDDFINNETEIVWLGLLDNCVKFYQINNKGSEFNESGSELLKNMILVLQSNGTLGPEKEDLWKKSWDMIGSIYPSLRNEFLASEPEVQQEKTEEHIATPEPPTEVSADDNVEDNQEEAL